MHDQLQNEMTSTFPPGMSNSLPSHHHRLRHTPNSANSDFQPPYFPPPYAVPPQPHHGSAIEFSTAADPYFNHHYNGSHQQYFPHHPTSHQGFLGTSSDAFKSYDISAETRKICNGDGGKTPSGPCYPGGVGGSYMANSGAHSRQDLFFQSRPSHDFADATLHFALQSGITLHPIDDSSQVWYITLHCHVIHPFNYV